MDKSFLSEYEFKPCGDANCITSQWCKHCVNEDYKVYRKSYRYRKMIALKIIAFIMLVFVVAVVPALFTYAVFKDEIENRDSKNEPIYFDEDDFMNL